MSSDGTRVAIGAIGTTAPALRRPRAGVRRERRDVDPGGRRHRRRGCGRLVRVLGIDVLGRHARGDRRYDNDGTGTTPATCGCTPRAAGRGPRWAPTSTARLRATSPGTRYRCPRTARAWRSALLERRHRHDAGHVRVYAESGGTWTQVGADIDGEAAGDQSGYSVSMSSERCSVERSRWYSSILCI